MEKYENIGKWNVSLDIPENVREILRQQFADYDAGIVPGNSIASEAKYISSYPHSVNKLKEIATPEENKLIDRLTPEDLRTNVLFELGRLQFIYNAKYTNPYKKSYIEHQLIGSAINIASDPFRVFSTYFFGKPIDTQERIMAVYLGEQREDNIELYFGSSLKDGKERFIELNKELIEIFARHIKDGWVFGEQILNKLDPISNFFQEQKELKEIEEFIFGNDCTIPKATEATWLNKFYYDSRIAVNIKTREALIKPGNDFSSLRQEIEKIYSSR